MPHETSDFISLGDLLDQSKSESPACSTAVEMPSCITILKGRCEINERFFTNDDMSLALKYAEMLWRRLSRMSEHYERQSANFMDGDIRGPMMACAAKDMKHVLRNCADDCQ